MSKTINSQGAQRRWLEFLYKTCCGDGLVPRSIQIELPCDLMGIAYNGGGFADVFKCKHRGQEVAVKVLRKSANSDPKKLTRVSHS